ncbi:MAG: amino acid adenylation domain-containing protein, partial [Pseudomonadota bacterium]
RYSNETDIVVGSPIANREQAEVEDLIGFFVNTLVLRSDLAGAPSFAALLAQSKAMLLDAYAHQQVPFEQIVERLQPQRSMRHSALFQILLVLQNNEEGTLALPGLTLSPVDMGSAIAKYELSLNMSESEQGLDLAWTYNSDLFEPATIARMGTHFGQLVTALLQAPQENVFSHDIVDARERQQLLAWNDTQAPYPSERCLHELFEEHAARYPDALALVCDGQQLSYGQLNAQANQLAHYLRAHKGVKPDTLVGVCLERSLEMVVAILGVLKAGAAYVPLDPHYPAARLAYMLADAKLDTVITHSQVQTGTPITPAQALCLDAPDLQQELAALPAANPAGASLGLTSRHLAYVIYTSGSTGNPKGVMVEHHALVNLALNLQALELAEQGGQWGWMASYAFDGSVKGLTQLMLGQPLHIISEQCRRDPSLLAPMLATLSVIDCTPMMVEAWFAAGIAQHLPHLIIGGEAISDTLWSLLLAWQARHGKKAVNVYGPTECTVDTTACLIEGNLPTIGKMLRNTQAYVLNGNAALAGQGTPGELHIGGVGLARGYLGQPALTAEKFIANPFHDPRDPHSSAKIYKTGDLVRWLADGKLEYLGRIDQQVKIRGYRIELGEIESALRAHAGVNDAVVLAKATAGGEKRLVAYLVASLDEAMDEAGTDAAQGQTEHIAALREHLGHTLPDYMFPSAFVFLDRIPLSPNGKVDRKALPEPDASQLHSPYVAPRTAAEQTLGLLWQEVLGVERVGLTDNFFQLGGHSLSATRLVAKINQAFDIVLPLKTLFVAQTLEALAQAVAQIEAGTGRAPLLRIGRGQALLPSFSQQRLWLLDQIDGGSAHYNMPGALKLDGVLDQGALARAFATILERHESLRTCFQAGDDGQVFQVIQAAQAVSIAVPLTDLSQLPDGEQRVHLLERITEEAGRAFDLGRDLMLRGQLLKLAADQHILLVTMHHIASDGWSMAILINEFSALYSAYVQGQGNPLPALEIQYADYAHWQRNWLQGEVLEQQLGYWTGQLANLPVVHSLPLDHARPPMQTFNGASISTRIDAATVAALKTLCQEAGATLFMGLHAAFSVLLARYSNETDIVVGSPIANREQAEVEDLIGFFVNTLVLRSDLAGAPSFAALLAQSKAMLLDAYAHQQVPFEQIVERLQPQRSMRHSALFQILLVLQNNEEGKLALPGLTLSPVDMGGTIAKYELSLKISESEQGMDLAWTYNTDLFEPTTITRMAAHFGLLLTALLKAPQDDVFSHAMLDAQERQQLLVDWNDTQAPYPSERCIHELFEEQVASHPDALAAVFHDRQLTFGELNTQANQLAHLLITQRQVKPDSLVGLCMERSVDMLVGIFGILKSGAAYVPLDPNQPEARIAYMLQDAALSTVVTHAAVQANSPISQSQALCLDDAEVRAALAAQSSDNIAPASLALTPQHLAYVIYTSGSTGNAKGVMVEHRCALNFWNIMRQSTHRTCPAHARVALNAAFTFDMSLKGILQVLSGHSLFIIPQGIRADGDAMLAFLQQHRIDAFDCTPSQLEVLIAAGLLENTPAQAHQLKSVLIGGEAISAAMWDKLRQVQGTDYFNMYGPTECTVDATMCLIRDAGPSTTIGKPIANMTVYILDANRQAVPVGVAGEIYIGGTGVARGYLQRPELSAERFLLDPFSSQAGARMYRTGDLARWTDDGMISYLGRNDFQVKIRGFRIELGEIETCLQACPGVRDAAVIAREDTPGNQRLVAYLTAEAHSSIDVATLRNTVGERLADYMVPSAFIVLDQLPLNANGKLDRKALPAPDLSQLQSAYTAPRTQTESRLCALWQEVLGLERVGLTDNFFQLGGHSLSATRLVAKINRDFGIVLPLKTLFVERTLEDLARAVAQADAGAARPALLRVARDSALLPSFAQQRLWLLDQIDGGSTHYNMPGALRLTGTLDYDALGRTVGAILERHESLRTCLRADAHGQVLQVIQALPSTAAAVPVTDLSGLHDGERRLHVLERMTEEAGRRFDLGGDLMLRAHLLKLAQDEHILLVTMHHIASDGWSMTILVNEFSALYGAFAQGRAYPLPALAIQYADYAHWQRNWLQGAVLEQQLTYWTTQLADLPVVHSLPLDHARPQMQTFTGASIGSRIDAHTVAALKALCQDAGATLFMGLHAAFSVLLARYSNETDIVVGSPIANREQVELEGLIGFFVNTLVLRSDLAGTPSFAALLAQSKSMLLDAYAHQQVPFEQIVERLQPERSMGHSALFQIMLVLQNNDSGTLALPGLTLSPVEMDSAIAKYELTLSMAESEHGLELGWTFNTDLFEVDSVTRMATHFEALLAAMLRAPQENVFSHDMLADQERKQLLLDWNATQAPYPSERCIHELFEEQAARTPDAPALLCDGRQLSYAQLNARANQLARHLLAQRACKPDTLVGVCLERSLDMVVAILAILKAGAAYVPLDPLYPAARLAYMLADAKLGTVITHSQVQGATPISPEQALCLDAPEVQQQLAAQQSANIPAASTGLTPQHLAYIIYTSGSTGNPKGVMIEHRNTVAFLSWARTVFGAAQLARVLASTSMCFDLSVFEMFAPLSVGGACLIVNNILELRRDDTRDFSLINTVPSAIEALLAGGHIPACVKTVNLAGEALKQSIVDKLYGSGVEAVHDLYGPSEDTTYSTYVLRQWHGQNSIGRPIHNSQMYVLNQARQLAPRGVAGELHIGGAGLARGYLDRPDLTAEKFIANPYAAQCADGAGAIIYKTGDLVRYLPDGELEYLGRIDHQVKIRGFRIELGEIENALASHALVADAVVLAREVAPGDKRLVAYVVHAAGADDATPQSDLTAALSRHLGLSLPEYMVPAAFVFLDALPRTPNGKLDRKALPDPDFAQQRNVYVAPATPTEQLVCEIWQDVLGMQQVGSTDNFFQLGGHSLLLMQVISRLQQTGIDVAVRQLFLAPTVAHLAAEIDQSGGRGAPTFSAPANMIPDDCEQLTPDMLPLVSLDASHIAAIVAALPGGARNVQDIYPLGPLQEGILFHHMLSAHSDPYVIPMLFKIRGEHALEEFLGALQFMVDRHDVLRTAVFWKGLPTPVQVVCRRVTLPVSYLEAQPGQDSLSFAQSLCARDAQHMDLSQPSLLKVKIVRDRAQPQDELHFVLLQVHHIITDHVGLDIIQKELALYHMGQADNLPATMAYREFIAHTQHQAKHNDAQAYFRQTLGDIDEPTAPFNLLDVQGKDGQILDHKLAVPAQVSDQIRRLAKEMRISPAVVFHAAWALVLAACSGRDDVVFGTVMSGRLQGTVGAENALGVFINTLPLRVKLKDIKARELIRQVHRALLDLLPYEQTPLALVQRCTSLSGGAPLFSAILNYRHSPQAAPRQADDADADDDNFERIGSHERTNYPCSLSVNDFGAAFGLHVHVNASVDPQRVAEYVQTALAGLLEALQNDASQTVAKQSILPISEQQQLLGWSAETDAFPVPHCVHELFEQQAARHPHAIALVYEQEQLSYAELNHKANQLAHYLLTHKQVRPDSLVGLCVERSVDMLVGILGILKAGGAYVPLDPTLPQARLAYMLEDADLATVITHRELQSKHGIGGAQALCLDDPATQAQLAAQPGTDIPVADTGLTPANLAYVIYTSGSTGKPKGALLEHRNVTRLFAATDANFGFGPADTWTMFHSYGFDFSVWEIWGALCYGGKLVIVPYLVSRTPELFHALLVEQRVTVLNQTPSAFMQLIAANAAAAPSAQLNLKYVIFGGEALNEAALQPWFAKHGQHAPQLINMYGITETTVHVTYQRVLADQAQGVNAIGRPIPDLGVYVLDAALNLAPIGVTGELHVSGAGLARGYLNRPELTAERFIDYPFAKRAGARLYKSGDLARYLPDGSIAYLGRIDSQVKIRGFRIELGEIESALSAHPQVKESLVLASQTASGDQRLVAYLVGQVMPAPQPEPADGATPLIAALRQHLAQTLPDYMIPAAFVVLDQMPLTANGKVDHKALPAPDMSQSIAQYVAPRTSMESRLCALWQEVLGIERVGVTDNFFQLGGHSLLAVRLVSTIEAHTGVRVPMAQLFTTPTVEALAAMIASDGPSTRLAVTMQRHGKYSPLFLIHPGGGGVSCYAALVTALADTCPVYAIQDADEAGIVIEPYDMDTIARVYAEEIVAVQAEGPYTLAGWSLGGNLAVKIANVLEQQGRQVQWVMLLDTFFPRKSSHQAQSLADFIADLLEGSAEELALRYDAERLVLIGRVKALVAEVGIEGFAEMLIHQSDYLDSALHFEKPLQALMLQKFHSLDRNARLTLGYTPAKLAAPLHRVWAEETVQGGADITAWNNWTDDGEHSGHHVLPGAHFNFVMGESMPAIAQLMRHYLKTASSAHHVDVERELG